MRISIFGLGYVDCVSAACLAQDGHATIGVDINPQKMALVAAGRAPVLESGLDELVGEVVRSGRLRERMSWFFPVSCTGQSPQA